MRSEYDAFISYNSRDTDAAETLATKLRDAGIKVWFDRWMIVPGTDWPSALSKAIDSAGVILILTGPDSMERTWVVTEIDRPFERAARLDHRIIPVLLPGGSPTLLPSFLRTRIYIDLREWDDNQLSRLIEALRPVPKIFLCHSKEDERRIEQLYHYLKWRGLDAWFDKTKLKIGDFWKEEIYQAIELTDFFAVFLSKSAVSKRGFIQNEIRTAIQEYQRRPYGSRYLLPIKLELCEIPRIRLDSNMLIGDLQWIEVFEGDIEAQRQLADDIWDQWRNK